MFHPHEAEGVHRVEHARVNCYLIEDGPRVLLVDAGLPAMWPMVRAALRSLGRSPRDIEALAITHGHFDHLGFALRLQQDLDVPVLIDPADAWIAAHPYRYRHERARPFYPIRYPASIPVLGRMTLAGALAVRGVTSMRPLDVEAAATLPGAPVPVATPGHTAGHLALHLPDRGVVITGDALVTLDPYTGASGPQIVSAAATADTRQALASLDAIAALDADIALPGHGDPFRGRVADAVATARHRPVT
ncbi:MBL fold metallo-hydrolase [Tersicoccus solisilvae]|uniref:MBL fold metallo-hydrolase n=1 Tax=Tersicoccus solisilvae TaxID=1882339 RepID=A0ABQ1NJA8_9MICC|nr:MBL fold metallo-hydrolase [Tersicoccus solisilvae]GGC78585.1 MBL fold metallo-hydrolase [Tersicoccus solisilvae]